MIAYYNENDPYAAEWLRNLIKADLIAPGHIDERDIRDVRPGNLEGFAQCHFFAGIGVWSYALRLAGWPDDRPIWTGSCPCQPFSGAGKRKGFADERHLWPVWFDLIRERRPGVILGEQVASKDGYAWLDNVQADVEGLDYPCGAVVTPAAGYGAPEERHRIYWMAHTFGTNQGRRRIQRSGESDQARFGITCERSEGLCATGGMADAVRPGRPERRTESGGRPLAGLGSAGRMDDSARERHGPHDMEPFAKRRECAARPADGTHASGEPATGPVNDFWRDADWLFCRDGKWRPVESGTFPLAHGIAARVGQLRAYGNAIVAPQAAEFIKAVAEELGYA